MKDIENAEPKSLGGILSNADFMKYLWISRNLDSSFENCRITAMGQGAGAASVEYLVHSPMIRWRIFLILILALLWSLGLFNSFKDLRLWQWQVIHVFLDLASLSMFLLWNWINIFIAFCGFVTKEFGWVHSNECNLASTKMGKHHIKQSHCLSTSGKK